jgi:hypothetical protein
MKKLTLSLLLIGTLTATAQTSPFIIEHCIDKMTDKEYYFSKKRLVCSNPEKTKGFAITPSFRVNKGIMVNNGLDCKNVNIGSCDEKDNLIILFEDDSKINLTAWNKFNCEGDAYFDFSDSELRELSSKKVKSIRFVNGYSFDSLTINLTSEQQDYFIRAYTNQKVVEINCSN